MNELREDVCDICGEMEECVVFFVEGTYYNIVLCKHCLLELIETFGRGK